RYSACCLAGARPEQIDLGNQIIVSGGLQVQIVLDYQFQELGQRQKKFSLLYVSGDLGSIAAVDRRQRNRPVCIPNARARRPSAAQQVDVDRRRLLRGKEGEIGDKKAQKTEECYVNFVPLRGYFFWQHHFDRTLVF